MTQGDIHNRKRTFDRLKKHILTSPEISERDKEILIEGSEDFPSFVAHMQNLDHSASRMNRYLRSWKKMLEHISWNIEEVTKTSMTELIGDLNTGVICKKNGEAYADSSKREFKKSIRKMYVDYVEKYKDELGFPNDFEADEDIINFTLTIDTNFTSPAKLPTPNTVRKLLENMDRDRDKAYLMLLWGTGGRNGEILGLKWRDIDFKVKVGKATFKETKTGGDHSVPMGEAYPFMKRLLETDEKSNEKDEYIFRSRQSGTQISSNGAASILERARKESSEIPDNIKTNPHAFRKGRTVFWIKQGKNEAWICKHMNWKPGSSVVAHYARVAKEDVEEGVSRHLGLQSAENDNRESQVLTPSECHKCGTISSFQASICRKCGEALRTGDLIKEFKVEEAKSDLKSKMIEEEIGLDDEEVEEAAKEIIEDKMVSR